MEPKTIPIKSISGKTIFEHTCIGNTIRITLELAIKSGANLSGANLSDANLNDANLNDAYLSGANLSGANLSDANLSDANLSDANLNDAYLSDANLSGAYLSGAYLPLYCKWSVSYKLDGKIKIGCKVKSIKDWDIFFESSEAYDTPRDTEDFKRIQANYNAVKAYMQTMGIE